MITFERDKETGVLCAYQDGKKIGEVSPMGDLVSDDGKDAENKEE